MGRLSRQKTPPSPRGNLYSRLGDTRVKTFCVFRWSPDDDSDLHTDTYEVDLDTCGRCRMGATAARDRQHRAWQNGRAPIWVLERIKAGDFTLRGLVAELALKEALDLPAISSRNSGATR